MILKLKVIQIKNNKNEISEWNKAPIKTLIIRLHFIVVTNNSKFDFQNVYLILRNPLIFLTGDAFTTTVSWRNVNFQWWRLNYKRFPLLQSSINCDEHQFCFYSWLWKRSQGKNQEPNRTKVAETKRNEASSMSTDAERMSD